MPLQGTKKKPDIYPGALPRATMKDPMGFAQLQQNKKLIRTSTMLSFKFKVQVFSEYAPLDGLPSDGSIRSIRPHRAASKNKQAVFESDPLE